MPNINDLFPSRWLKAADLAGNEFDVTIQVAKLETVHNPRAKKEEQKLAVYFKGTEKGLLLNKTNANSIAMLLKSDQTEDWPGGRVRLYPTEVQAGGEVHQTIRIKAAVGTVEEAEENETAAVDALVEAQEQVVGEGLF